MILSKNDCPLRDYALVSELHKYYWHPVLILRCLALNSTVDITFPWHVQSPFLTIASPILVSIILAFGMYKLEELTLTPQWIEHCSCQELSYLGTYPTVYHFDQWSRQFISQTTTNLTIILFCQLTLLFYINCCYTPVLLLIKKLFQYIWI